MNISSSMTILIICELLPVWICQFPEKLDEWAHDLDELTTTLFQYAFQ